MHWNAMVTRVCLTILYAMRFSIEAYSTNPTLANHSLTVHMESISFMFTPANQRTFSSRHQNKPSSANAMWQNDARPTSYPYVLLLLLIGWNSILCLFRLLSDAYLSLYFISGGQRKLFSMSTISDLFSEILNRLKTWYRRCRACVLTS